jgi:hypothetical protein
MIRDRRSFLAAAAGTALGAGGSHLWAKQPAMTEDSVFELRQYTLHRGQRDTLIALFEKAFVEPQNALGAHVIGTFRDRNDSDRFVWLRGFRDMPTRQQALGSFYGGPVWQANRAAANATILDSDNVLLLRAAGEGLGFSPQAESHSGPDNIIGAVIYYLGSADATLFAQFFDEAVLPHLQAAGAQPIARLVTEEAANNFPRLPIREHDRTFIVLSRWANAFAENAFVARFAALSGWRDSAPESILPAFMRKPERLQLMPTDRSTLR